MSSLGLDDEIIKTIKESKIDAAEQRRFATERSSVAVLHGIHGKHVAYGMHEKRSTMQTSIQLSDALATRGRNSLREALRSLRSRAATPELALLLLGVSEAKMGFMLLPVC